MLLILRFLVRLVAIADFIAFTAFLWLLSWLPWRGRHPVARMFGAWSRAFVRALGVDLRLHQKNRKHLPARYILIANHPSAFEDVGIPALFRVVSLAKVQVADWFVVGRISKAAGTLYVDRDDPQSRHAAIDTMVNAVNAGQNIALYPKAAAKVAAFTTSSSTGPSRSRYARACRSSRCSCTTRRRTTSSGRGRPCRT